MLSHHIEVEAGPMIKT